MICFVLKETATETTGCNLEKLLAYGAPSKL